MVYKLLKISNFLFLIFLHTPKSTPSSQRLGF